MYIQKLFTVLSAMILASLLISCEKNNNNLVGRWSGVTEGQVIVKCDEYPSTGCHENQRNSGFYKIAGGSTVTIIMSENHKVLMFDSSGQADPSGDYSVSSSGESGDVVFTLEKSDIKCSFYVNLTENTTISLRNKGDKLQISGCSLSGEYYGDNIR